MTARQAPFNSQLFHRIGGTNPVAARCHYQYFFSRDLRIKMKRRMKIGGVINLFAPLWTVRRLIIKQGRRNGSQKCHRRHHQGCKFRQTAQTDIQSRDIPAQTGADQADVLNTQLMQNEKGIVQIMNAVCDTFVGKSGVAQRQINASRRAGPAIRFQ